MKHKNSLNLLQIGQTAQVEKITASGAMRRRLQDIGLTPGTRVQCLLESPSGDPAAYLVRGALIALRREDSALVGTTQIE